MIIPGPGRGGRCSGPPPAHSRARPSWAPPPVRRPTPEGRAGSGGWPTGRWTGSTRAGVRGEWEPFLAMLTPRFSFWFPDGQWRGRHEGEAGRQAIAAWARFHADNGNRVEGLRRGVTVMGDRVLYEYDSRGASASTAGYLNWETIIVRVAGERISALHEYWGNVPPVG
ncbi:nuclear transport factor 2 family protein [Nonomuraea candida]|uniref:nuclear transport factor 2 family protein n=1 Tax=Nonomuraea candida TaxID=359159 RepID=UPI0012F8297A|nr:nuclear transport factor 2 family protein [Nonomuraea candida]